MSDILKSLSQDMAALVKAAAPSIVRLEARRRIPGSGIVWSADGVIVTTHHVMEQEENITVGLEGGDTITANLVGRDPATDLAVLRADAADLTPANWVETSELSVGHLVLALGRPGITTQATLGVISALGMEWQTPAGGKIDTYFQTDVTMYPGFSGGPLVTADGSFAGVNSSALMRGMSHTIPTATVRNVVETLLAHGHIQRGYLGVGVQPVELPDAIQESLSQETGVMFMSVEADSPAAESGLLQGDILVTLAGTPVRHIDDLQQLLQSGRVGQTVPLQFVRSGELQSVETTITARESSGDERTHRGRRGGPHRHGRSGRGGRHGHGRHGHGR